MHPFLLLVSLLAAECVQASDLSLRSVANKVSPQELLPGAEGATMSTRIPGGSGRLYFRVGRACVCCKLGMSALPQESNSKRLRPSLNSRTTVGLPSDEK